MGTDAPQAETRGVLYVAKGADYADLAVQSALSLRQVDPTLPIEIMTDASVRTGVFDWVSPLPKGRTRDKIAGMLATRFDRTLFLDCDTLVVGPLAEGFDLLDRFELCISHEVRRSSRLITTGWKETPPDIFGQHNSGVIYYRKSAKMMAILQAWAEAYVAAAQGRDQVTLRDLLWASDLRFWVLPPEFNLRRVTIADIWEPLDAVPRVIHSHHLLRHLRHGLPRVTSFAEILELERAAHKEEWAAREEPSDILAGLSAARETEE
ncbi:hypothetical protein ACSBLW_09770 [Thioclava sp. FR2]|uniref:hypothetical protein n=1 Tax=Thioclava sp. FR2 TaxID=3445780 RepID=UPI003EBD834D